MASRRSAKRIPEPTGARDWFLGFRCPRCGRLALHVPSATKGLVHYVFCPGCHACYSVKGGVTVGLLLGAIVVVLSGALIALLSPLLAAGWVRALSLLLAASFIAVAVLILGKPRLARRFQRYQYVGRARSVG